MDKVEVDEALLQEIVRRLVAAVDPDKIILFGSRARGDTNDQSDVDVMIVKPPPGKRKRWTPDAYLALRGIGVPVDVLWYTPEDFSRWSRVSFHVVAHAVKEGRVLYERRTAGDSNSGPESRS
jgi:predicted nucleotidyltransferase